VCLRIVFKRVGGDWMRVEVGVKLLQGFLLSIVETISYFII
jgi:hypothetical protein